MVCRCGVREGRWLRHPALGNRQTDRQRNEETMCMKNCQNKRTAQRLVPSERCRLAEDTALKRGPHVRKLRKIVNSNREDWKALARKAAHEHDPKKLLSIVEELNKALEERENQLRGGVSKRIATKREGGNELLFVDEPSIRLTLLHKLLAPPNIFEMA